MRPITDPLQQTDRVYVRWRGRKFLFFGGCDYFRISSHPRILAAMKKAIPRFGLSVAASRMTTGEHVLYQQLETQLAEFFDVPTATLFSCGYLANLAVGQALSSKHTVALIDERAHMSLWDASGQLNCAVRRYRHRDMAALQKLIAVGGKQSRPIVFTDGMFAYDGSVAPLKQIMRHLPVGGVLMVDDAHGAGMLGKQGKGTIELEGISRARVIQTVTLSKAFGVYGGAVLGSIKLREQIVKHSRIFTGNTPMPLPLVNAAVESVKILSSDKSMRLRLQLNVARLRDRLASKSCEVETTPGPIVRITPKSENDERRIRSRLINAGIYPSFIRYPGWPGTGCFRFVVSSEHTQRHLDSLADSL